jgi:hypothetical protein
MNDKDESKKFKNWTRTRAYLDWMDELWRDQELLDITISNSRKPYGIDIRSVAQVIALYGANGYWSLPMVETVAEHFCCSPRTIKTCRKRLIELGWFRVVSRNGGTYHRSLVLEIAIKGEIINVQGSENAGS